VNFVVGGALALAVNNDKVVFTQHTYAPGTGTTTEVHALRPATDPDPSKWLTSLWSYNIVGDMNRVAPTLYGRYVLVGTEGATSSTYGHLYLFESRGTSVSLIWTFTPTLGDIATAPTVYKDVVLVRATSTLYALPFVDPNGNGVIDSSEVRWTFDLGAWSGNKFDVALGSGPAAKAGYVFIGSHAGMVYKIAIAGTGPRTPVWSHSVGGSVQSVPGMAQNAIVGGIDGIYVISTQAPSVVVYELNGNTGAQVNSATYSNANAGRSSVTLAGGKAFLWIGDSGGAWIVVLTLDLSTEIYRVSAGPYYDGNFGEGISPAIADGWVFAGNGAANGVPPTDSWGFVFGWSS